MVGLTPLFSDKHPDFASFNKPNNQFFFPKKNRFSGYSFGWLESPIWLRWKLFLCWSLSPGGVPHPGREWSLQELATRGSSHDDGFQRLRGRVPPSGGAPCGVQRGGIPWRFAKSMEECWEHHRFPCRSFDHQKVENTGKHRFTSQILGFHVNWLSFSRNTWAHIWAIMSHWGFKANSGIPRLCSAKTILEEQGEAEKKEELRMQKEEQEKRHQLLRRGWENPFFCWS